MQKKKIKSLGIIAILFVQSAFMLTMMITFESEPSSEDDTLNTTFTINPKKFLDALTNIDIQLNEAFYRVESSNMLVIEGSPGHGKTSILMAVARKFGGFGKVIYVDCKKLDTSIWIKTHY